MGLARAGCGPGAIRTDNKMTAGAKARRHCDPTVRTDGPCRRNRRAVYSTGILAFSTIIFIFLLSLMRNSRSFSPGSGGSTCDPVFS